MTVKLVFDQVQEITTTLIRVGATLKQNFPTSANNKVSWSGYQNLSYVLKNKHYRQIYEQCLENKDYNLLLLDYALIQIYYEFSNDQIIRHRLAYLPNPYVYNAADFPEQYQEMFMGDNVPPDLHDENVVVFPMRFDYDNNDDKYVELYHPHSHLTLGNYSDCRIPVSSPLTPFKFIRFILMSFYKYTYVNDIATQNQFICHHGVPSSISSAEESALHIHHR